MKKLVEVQVGADLENLDFEIQPASTSESIEIVTTTAIPDPNTENSDTCFVDFERIISESASIALRITRQQQMHKPTNNFLRNIFDV